MPVPAAVLRLLASDSIVDIAAGGDESTPDAEGVALLSFLASLSDARTMVEVGSAKGVTAAALVAGQRHRGIVTSIEADRESHDAAVSRLAGPINEGRVRLMHGAIDDVLGRLSDDGYGLALLQQEPGGYDEILDEVVRLLSPGGLLIARRVLDPAHADAVAPFLQRVAELSSLSTIVDVDGGLLLATID